jgi:hypothetical protein
MVLTVVLENDRMPQNDRVVDAPGRTAGRIAECTSSRGRSQGGGEEVNSQTVTHLLSEVHTHRDVNNLLGILTRFFKNSSHWKDEARSRGS